MGYSVHVGNQDFNYTYNLSRFFKDVGVDINGRSGRTCEEVSNEITQALKLIDFTIGLYGGYKELEREYNPKNGWGDVYGAISFLSKVAAACSLNTSPCVRVWS